MKFKEFDRRYIYLIIALAVIIPCLFPVKMPVNPTRPVKDIYNKIETLPAGSCVLLSFDYGPDAIPELQPAARSILAHCFKKNIKVVAVSLWPHGANISDKLLKEMKERFSGLVYGTDYINLGYKPGGVIVIQKMGSSIIEVFPSDISGHPCETSPLMQSLKNLSDFSLIISFTGGRPGIKEYIEIANAQFNSNVAGATTAVIAPELYPFLKSGQLLGLIAGMRGAAEYEILEGEPSSAVKYMTPLSLVHILIIVFIILGNINYFMLKNRSNDTLGGEKDPEIDPETGSGRPRVG